MSCLTILDVEMQVVGVDVQRHQRVQASLMIFDDTEHDISSRFTMQGRRSNIAEHWQPRNLGEGEMVLVVLLMMMT